MEPSESDNSRSIARSEQMWERALRVIPGGTQTLSKAPSQFVDGVSPKFLRRGKGSHVWDVDGNEYVDWPMSLGPILLGHDYPRVSEAVIKQLHDGTTFTMMHPLEVEVAELLVEMIPCAERVRFAKNGADATTGAIRAARASTGREHVICTGYHGYQDWYIASTELNDGVPVAARGLIHPVAFNQIAALEDAFVSHPDQVAAVIMELPGEEPQPGYLSAARDLAHRHGALFILDEIVTGFRYANGGAQELHGVIPDLACFGKGMANGYPISAVVGSADAMEAFERIFFSMTYSGETLSLAATLATLTILREEPVVEHLWRTGETLRAGIESLIGGLSFEVELGGNPPRSGLTFMDSGGELIPELRAIFLQETHKAGILFGVPIFPSYSHTDEDLVATLNAVEGAFARMDAAHRSGDYGAYLEGLAPGTVFRSHR